MTYHQLKYLLWSVVVGVTLSLTSCMKWDYGDAVEDFNATGAGLFITNEGNFQYGNATLSYYDPATKPHHLTVCTSALTHINIIFSNG